MRHLLIGALAGAVAFAWLAAIPSAASACSSDSPTFAEAVNGARAIARVTVIDGFDGRDQSQSETYRVERVLKGDLPKVVTVAPAWTGLCQDTIGYYAGPKGSTVVVAFGVPFYGETIHPLWQTVGDEGVFGTAGVPDHVETLAELEHAILAKLGLPDTATGETSDAQGMPFTLIALATGAVAFAVTLWRTVTRAGARRKPGPL